MDYKKILQQIQEGSIMQRKRKQHLDKEKKRLLQNKKTDKERVQKLEEIIRAQLLYCKKIQEGNRNSRRTLKLRLFISRFQKNSVFEQLQSVDMLLSEFDTWLFRYKKNIQTNDWEKEKISNNNIFHLLEKYEKKKKEVEQAIKKEKEMKNKAMLLLAQIMLTTIILLFKETKRIPFDKEIFCEQRYNPLNPFFPFKL